MEGRAVVHVVVVGASWVPVLLLLLLKYGTVCYACYYYLL